MKTVTPASFAPQASASPPLPLAARLTRAGVARLREAATTLSTRVRRLVTPGLELGEGVRIAPSARIHIVGRGRIRIGSGSWIDDHVLLQARDGEIEIGENAFVGFGAQIVSLERIVIGRDALIASGCVVRDCDHGMRRNGVPMRAQEHNVAPIVIGDDVWLASHAVVTRGTEIGSGAIIGANAVARGRIPSLAVASGIPAKVHRYRGDP